jgi:hypothetical protein
VSVCRRLKSFTSIHLQPDLDQPADGFGPRGLTPSVDGRPNLSRSWATEVFPKSGSASSAASDISRTSPTVFRPAANKAFSIRVGNRISRIGVLSGSSGVASSLLKVFRCAAHFEANSAGRQTRQLQLWVGKPAAQFEGRPGRASSWTVAVIPATRRTPNLISAGSPSCMEASCVSSKYASTQKESASTIEISFCPTVA